MSLALRKFNLEEDKLKINSKYQYKYSQYKYSLKFESWVDVVIGYIKEVEKSKMVLFHACERLNLLEGGIVATRQHETQQ